MFTLAFVMRFAKKIVNFLLQKLLTILSAMLVIGVVTPGCAQVGSVGSEEVRGKETTLHVKLTSL